MGKQEETVTLSRVWVRENIITITLALFIVLSLLLHAATLLSLWRIRDVVHLQLQAAASQIHEAQLQQVHYDFPIKQSFPFATSIVISETVDVPIQDSFPIKQRFTVPFDLNSILPGAGTISIPIPIDVSIPVSTTLHVPIQKTIPFRTTIDVNTTVPFELNLGQPPLGDLLRRIEASFQSLLGKL
ncbi:MAG: hypothetical protein NVS4B8_06760 [Herpetosiphon sp.]